MLRAVPLMLRGGVPLMKKYSKRYYDELFAEHGYRGYCPICDCRPCYPGDFKHPPCRLGIFREDELVKLSNRLRHLDDPRTRS